MKQSKDLSQNIRSEKKLQTQILRELGSHKDFRLFRNSVGLGYTGAVTQSSDGYITIQNPHPSKFGLCKGSADIIGLQRIKITPDMVGTYIAKFISIEVKSPTGRVTDDQMKWSQMILNFGGTSIIAKSMDDIKPLIAD